MEESDAVSRVMEMEETPSLSSISMADWADLVTLVSEVNTMFIQMEEEKGAIRTLSFVTTLSSIRTVKDKTQG
jgi:hypothetical protein